MLAVLRRFVWDENYASQVVRSIIGMIGFSVATGVISVPAIPANTPGGWYVERVIGILLAGCAWWVRAGEKNRTHAEIAEIARDAQQEGKR